jgi:hypothetical protein
MRGRPQFNFPAFFEATMTLRELGLSVFNPAERDMSIGFDPSKPIDHPDNVSVFSLADAFEWDFEAIRQSDAIVLLPNWADSKGVQSELVLAITLGLDIYEWVNGALLKMENAGYTVSFDLHAHVTVSPS